MISKAPPEPPGPWTKSVVSHAADAETTVTAAPLIMAKPNKRPSRRYPISAPRTKHATVATARPESSKRAGRWRRPKPRLRLPCPGSRARRPGPGQVGAMFILLCKPGGLDLDIRRRCHNMPVLYWYTAICLSAVAFLAALLLH